MAHGTYDEYWQARNVPKDLVNINHPVLIVAALVRCAGLLRPVPDVPRAEREESGEQDDVGGRAVAARRLGAQATATRSVTSTFGVEDCRVLPHEHRAAVLQLLSERQRDARISPKRSCSRPAAIAGTAIDAVAAAGTRPRKLYLQGERQLVVHARRRIDRPTPSTITSAIPRKPVPYTAEIPPREGHLFMVEDQRFAWPSVLTCSSIRRRCSPRIYDRRADRREPAGVDHRAPTATGW